MNIFINTINQNGGKLDEKTKKYIIIGIFSFIGIIFIINFSRRTKNSSISSISISKTQSGSSSISQSHSSNNNVTRSLSCQTGQGDSTPILILKESDLNECENKCRNTTDCLAFDYSHDKSCRLFSYNKKKSSNNKQFCSI